MAPRRSLPAGQRVGARRPLKMRLPHAMPARSAGVVRRRRLALEDPRKAKVVELRFFGGLSVEETAAALDVSPRTVQTDWAFARAWLYRTLTASHAQ
jgi:DNA-directed RNA polymerase specialized sigma24 family protein